MNWTKGLVAMLLALGVSGAVAFEAELGHGTTPEQIENPSPGRFSVCYQHGCARVDHLELGPSQWNRVREIFQPGITSAAEERDRIKQAISYLELEVGKQTQTLNDVGGSFQGFVAAGNQLDCIDESTNSTTYLRMMQGDGLLKFHTVAARATRARGTSFFISWPHSTAVITDTTTGEEWAVDSWFGDNGEPPAVVPLSLWRSGWAPDA